MGSNPTSDNIVFYSFNAGKGAQHILSTLYKSIHKVAWPSGLRRWFKAPVSSGAWVRIPPLPNFLIVGKNLRQWTHGFEPWTYRTAADCSTTELYPQAVKLVLLCLGLKTCVKDRQIWLVCMTNCEFNAVSCVGGIMVSIAAFQAVDPGSIPGRRNFWSWISGCLVRFKLHWQSEKTRWPSG